MGRKTMERRAFVKTVMVGGAAFSFAAAAWPTPLMAAGGAKADIGQCKSVKITSVSEVGWWDTAKLKRDVRAGGGPKQCSQWATPWDPANAAGSCSLVEVTGLKGETTRILLDTGWNPEYMAWRFQATGVDKLLRECAIDYLIISHEHLDHFWGLEATLMLDPDITMLIPSTFRPEAHTFMNGGVIPGSGMVTRIAHRGMVRVMKPGGVHKLFDGAGVAVFDMPIILKVRGEQSLVFNVKDKGLVLVTGCCHQSITRFADFAREQIKGGENLYGLYGGLHLAPFGALGEKQAQMVRDMANYGFSKMACNHCTGVPAVAMMNKLGYPVVSGSGTHGSRSDMFVGNGDSVTFG